MLEWKSYFLIKLKLTLPSDLTPISNIKLSNTNVFLYFLHRLFNPPKMDVEYGLAKVSWLKLPFLFLSLAIQSIKALIVIVINTWLTHFILETI